MKSIYYDFREKLSKNINNSEFKIECEECFLIEESLNNELIKYFENNDNIQDKNAFGNIQSYIINDFPSTLYCLYKNKKINLISKKLIESIFNNDDLKDLIGVKYYCGNNKLIIEYKDTKALLLNEPLTISEFKKSAYIIYIENKEEKDKNSFFEYIISEKLDMNQYNSDIKDNIVSFERFLNINKGIIELFISILNYENNIKENMKNVFKENEEYFLINSEWIKICKDYCSKISDYYLNIKNHKIEIKDNNIDDIFKSMSENKIIFNLEHKKLFEDIMNKEKVNPQIGKKQNTEYYINSYIINSQIKELITKLLNHEVKKINIFINDEVNIVSEKKITIGNLNENFMYIPKYILFYQLQKTFPKEKDKLFKSSFEKYIEPFNFDLKKEDEQILKEKNKKIGKLIILPAQYPQKENLFSKDSKDDKKEIIEQMNKKEDIKNNTKEMNFQINKNQKIIVDSNEILEKTNMNFDNNINSNKLNFDLNQKIKENNDDNIIRLIKQLEQTKKEISELKEVIKNKENVIENQKEIIQNKDKVIEINNKEVENKMKEIQNQKEDIQSKDKEIESKEEDMKNKDNEISKLKENIKNKDKEIQNQKDEILKIKKENNELILEKDKEINILKNIKEKRINEYRKEYNKEIIPPKKSKSRNKYKNNDLVPGRDSTINESDYKSTMDTTTDKLLVNNINLFKSLDNNINSNNLNFDLNKKIKENNDDNIIRLTKELEQSQKDNLQLKEEIKSKESIIENQKESMQNKDKEIETKIKEMENKVKEIIQNKNKEISNLKEDMKKKDKEIESQKEEILKIKKENNDLNLEKDKENNNLKNIILKLKEENSKFKSFEEASKNTVDKLNKNIENLMKEKKDIENYSKNNIVQIKQEFFDEYKRIYLSLCFQNSNKEAQEKILFDKLKGSNENYFRVLKKEIDSKIKEIIKEKKKGENETIENQKAIISIIEKEKEINKKISFLEDKENFIDKENKEIELKKKQFEKEIEKNKIIIQKNNELSKKNEELEKEIKKKMEKLNELENKMKKNEEILPKIPIMPDKPILIGLNNIGATCFMNSTLQCLSQTKELTKYFLNANNENRIINNNIALANRNALQLSPIYLELLKKLWDKNGEKSFSPYNFMNVVEKMNPLFKQGQAGDSKDFIIFILEQLHKELKKSVNNNDSNNNLILNQYDKGNAFNYFFNDFKKECSIISDIFFGFTETTNECLYCKNYYNSQGYNNNPICYNYGIFNCLIFPLEEVKNMKNNYIQNNNIQINNNCVSLYECFYYNQKSELFSGDNRNYCNICKQLWDSIYTSKIFISPINLIIILNRGKGNIYDVKLDFTETIDITQFVLQKDKPQIIYNLYGVITHIGQSGPNAHFIASCKNSIDNKWYRFNDAFITPINDFQKEVIEFGTPYILFYKKNL